MNKRTIVGALAVFLFLLIAVQTVTAKPSAKDLLKEGDLNFKLWRSRDQIVNMKPEDAERFFNQAISSYERIISEFPKSKEAQEAKKRLADPLILAYQEEKAVELAREQEKKQQEQAKKEAEEAERVRGIINLYSAFEGTVLINGEETKFKARVRTRPDVYTKITIENAKDKEFSVAVRDSTGKVYQAGKVLFEKTGRDYFYYDFYIPNPEGTFTYTPNSESDFEVTITSDGRGVRITNYIGKDKDVIIPPTIQGLPVRIIGGFSGYRNRIDSVIIPEGVTTISAFCFSLGRTGTVESVNIPSTVTSIGDNAFEGCKNLGTIVLPKGLKNLGEEVFESSGIYVFPDWPKGITTIPKGTFSNTALTNVVIPNGVTTIGIGAFKGCKSLTSVTLPATIKKIEGIAFADTNVREIIIPSSVTKIEFNGGAGFSNKLPLASQAALKRLGYDVGF